ncbi:ATP-binding cassette domain-containing protein [Saccharomonospora sp. NB11]|jgi:oleandomycin transport system ATP-binding protein|uniref:ATP-binding cassette domain-containing protein n=1 Tax=Saccharomonospora sp. NB11 TaxID=1642298 RepID=UPI0018D0E313|nr:ATP-binding cassette domain-containing protein [Saccharomonospora sp. NB11]
MRYAVEAEGLAKTFGETTALSDFDIVIPPGRVVGLLGPNGAGKTTAVRILATLTRPDAGRALVYGHDVVRDPVRVRRLIGLTGQYASLDEDLSGMENLVLVGRLLNFNRAVARRRAEELLDAFDIVHAAHRPVRTYSGGMRRRIDLAASIVGRPRVLFLDEPTTGLDPRVRNDMWTIIRQMVDDGMSVLLTTQYLEEADELADRITVLDGGRVIAEGKPHELKQRIGSQTLQVRIAPGPGDETVTRILTELTGSRPDYQPETRTFKVSVHDPGLLSAVVRRLDSAQITVEELALRLPSLDEVFLGLTGQAGSTGTDERSTSETSAGKRSEPVR